MFFWSKVDQRAPGLGRSCCLCFLTEDNLSRSSVSCFRLSLHLGFGDQPCFSICVPGCYAFFGSLQYLIGKQVAEQVSACKRKFLQLLAQATSDFPQSLKDILRRVLSLMGMPEKVWKYGKCFHLSLSVKITIHSRGEKNSAGGLLEWCERMEELGNGYLFGLISLMVLSDSVFLMWILTERLNLPTYPAVGWWAELKGFQ